MQSARALVSPLLARAARSGAPHSLGVAYKNQRLGYLPLPPGRGRPGLQPDGGVRGSKKTPGIRFLKNNS